MITLLVGVGLYFAVKWMMSQQENPVLRGIGYVLDALLVVAAAVFVLVWILS